MQVGNIPSEFLLPSQFERVHQPTKLIQFDKIFSRVFAKPIRLSRISSIEDDTDLLIVNRQKIHPSTTQSNRERDKDQEDLMDEGYSETTLGDFINEHGYTSACSPNLSNFRRHALTHSTSNQGNETCPSFVGSNIHEVDSCEAYICYTNRAYTEVGLSKRKCREDEFIQCLQDSLLQSDDVDGILKVSIPPLYTLIQFFVLLMKHDYLT